MNQKVLVIDDKPDLAEAIAESISNYRAETDCVGYEVKVLKGINVFSEAKDFLETNIAQIDIILADYNLNGSHKGTELFNLINKSKYLIYRILHSITTKSLTLAQDDMALFDYFCSSKDINPIQESLRKYEKEILDIKLNGHPRFRDKYFVSNNRLRKEAAHIAKNQIKYFDILFVESDGKGNETMTINYRNNITQQVENDHSTSLKIKDFRDTDLYFRKVNSSLIINLLWVSSINRTNNTIRFITNNNLILEKNFFPTALFDSDVVPFLSAIESEMPAYFKG